MTHMANSTLSNIGVHLKKHLFTHRQFYGTVPCVMRKKKYSLQRYS